MSVYLHDIPLPEALGHFKKALSTAGLNGVLGVEEILLDVQAVGRTLAAPVWAQISSPHYHSSAMDGFAVRAGDTDGATQTNPIILEYSRQTIYVDTGDPLPEGFNAVIPIENIEPLDDREGIAFDPRRPDKIRIREAVVPWKHIRSLGEDIVATQLVLPQGHVLRPIDLGAIAGCGHSKVQVARKPKVAVIPTGSELVEIGRPVTTGDIIEYNSLVLAAQVNEWGGEAVRLSIVPDDIKRIKEQVRAACQEFDLILLNAGSSAGAEDYSAEVVEELGSLLVHGVAVRPGHPVILGMIDVDEDRQIPIIGVPGYPVSAALTAEIFIEPLLSLWLGKRSQEKEIIEAELTKKITSPPGDDDFVRVAVGRVGNRLLAAPLTRGAGVITSLVRADGLAILPRGSQGAAAGSKVQVHLYRSRLELNQTIFAIGSHDITLDLLAQHLATYQRRLSSANVGSLGGLVALRRGEAHIAGSHLLDPESGQYNLSYIEQYLPGVPAKVIGLVGREQGLIVQKGNPKGITNLQDLLNPDVQFINRQKGAGTRVLLDYQLGLQKIPHQGILGYEREEYTHLAVAAAITSGRADCGLGIAAAANALDLDFVPLFKERYDIIIPDVFIGDALLAPLFSVLESTHFRNAVQELPGYDTSPLGRVIAEVK
jgi:putative molybdopterin biosynthesis protein